MKSQKMGMRSMATAVAAVAAAVMLIPAANAAAPAQGLSTSAHTAASVKSESGKPHFDIANGAMFDPHLTTNYNCDLPNQDGVFVRVVNKTDAPVRIKVEGSVYDSKVPLQPGKVMLVAGSDGNANSVDIAVHSEKASWGTVWFNDPWFAADDPEGGFSYHDHWEEHNFPNQNYGRQMSHTSDQGSFKLTMAVNMNLRGTPKSLGWSGADAESVGWRWGGGSIADWSQRDWEVFSLDILKMQRR